MASLALPFITVIAFVSSALIAEDNRSVAISASELRERRMLLRESMDSASVAIVGSAEVATRTSDVNFPYRQSSDFLYLTNIAEPNSFLVILKDGIQLGNQQMHDILFTPPFDERQANITGRGLTNIDAMRISGVDTVFSVLEFGPFLKKLLANKPAIRVLYHTALHPRFVYDWLNDRKIFLERDAERLLKVRYSSLAVKSISPLIASLRITKSPTELRLIRKAVQITCDGIQAVFRATRPGMKEYELQAILEYTFRREGAEWTSFPSIVASGPNSTKIHYDLNQRAIKAGDLVVLDVGAEYQGYAADITRTFPVGGTFSEAQRKIYEMVLRAQEAAIKVVKPGARLRDVDRAARDVIEKAGFKDYFTHFVGHPIGLDVHDPGLFAFGSGDTLRTGMVITVEPGVYVPHGAAGVDSAYWNIGVRIEDDVLVTRAGHQVLSSCVPKQTEEIEALLRSERDRKQMAP
ncbi:MAG: aminopeptidase P N-terminal domain-containing protein [Bacteroidota bacterium]